MTAPASRSSRRRVSEVHRKAGKLLNLEKELAEHPPARYDGNRPHPLGHARGPDRPQRAPPTSTRPGGVAVVHNGIIENFARLRDELERDDVEFESETDTEVVAHLLGRALVSGAATTLADAMRLTCQRLEGAFTLVAVDGETPGVVVAARRNSPLVVGLGEGREHPRQ